MKKLLILIPLIGFISCQNTTPQLESKVATPEVFVQMPSLGIYYDQKGEAVIYSKASEDQMAKVKNAQSQYTITYGYSFGECRGFCKSKLIFSSEGVLKTATRWKDDYQKIQYFPITQTTYDSLVQTIDFPTLLTFNKYLGCGDCADGGAEWIEICKGSSKKVLSGTYGFTAEPIQKLLSYIRKQ